MSALRAALRPLYDTALGDRLRAWTGLKPPINVRPYAATATVSDLFPWRVDATWETCFELVNLPSLLYPDEAPRDRVSLAIFGADGRDLGRHAFDLAPFETRRIEIGALLGTSTGFGSFACFHAAPCLRALARHGCHLSERGYVGFRRRGDGLWSYSHGNLHVLAAVPGETSTHVAARSRHEWSYRPQLRFDDAKAFDLVYSNPVNRPVTLNLRFVGPAGREVERAAIELPVRATAVVSRTAQSGHAIERIESRGRCGLWRPLVFKHYESHFDVFHG